VQLQYTASRLLGIRPLPSALSSLTNPAYTSEEARKAAASRSLQPRAWRRAKPPAKATCDGKKSLLRSLASLA